MTRARDTARIRIETTNTRLAEHADGLLVKNEDIFESDLTVGANSRVAVAGPVTIPNVTGTLSFGSAGMLNIIG